MTCSHMYANVFNNFSYISLELRKTDKFLQIFYKADKILEIGIFVIYK